MMIELAMNFHYPTSKEDVVIILMDNQQVQSEHQDCSIQGSRSCCIHLSKFNLRFNCNRNYEWDLDH